MADWPPAASVAPQRLCVAGVWGEPSPQVPPEGAEGEKEGDLSQTLPFKYRMTTAGTAWRGNVGG